MMSRSRRNFLFDRQGGCCCWCKRGMELEADRHSKHAATIEHLVPLAKRKKRPDGRSAAYRLLACRKCNTGRKCEIAPDDMLALAARYHVEWLQTQPAHVRRQKEHAIPLLVSVDQRAA